MSYFKQNIKNNRWLFLITIFYLFLPIINIHFALLGFICMIVPIVLLLKTKRATFCQGYCPRSNLLTKTKKLNKNHRLKISKQFTNGQIRNIVFTYFIISLSIMVITTIRVYLNQILPMEEVRLWMVIPLGKLPQVYSFYSYSWLVHLSYRIYSMILSTTILGLVFAIIYQPRSWCIVCPITTISKTYIGVMKKG